MSIDVRGNINTHACDGGVSTLTYKPQEKPCSNCGIDPTISYFIKPKHDSNEAYRRLMVVRDTIESFQRDINDAGVYSIPKELVPIYENVISVLNDIEMAELEIVKAGE